MEEVCSRPFPQCEIVSLERSSASREMQQPPSQGLAITHRKRSDGYERSLEEWEIHHPESGIGPVFISQYEDGVVDEDASKERLKHPKLVSAAISSTVSSIVTDTGEEVAVLRGEDPAREISLRCARAGVKAHSWVESDGDTFRSSLEAGNSYVDIDHTKSAVKEAAMHVGKQLEVEVVVGEDGKMKVNVKIGKDVSLNVQSA